MHTFVVMCYAWTDTFSEIRCTLVLILIESFCAGVSLGFVMIQSLDSTMLMIRGTMKAVHLLNL